MSSASLSEHHESFPCSSTLFIEPVDRYCLQGRFDHFSEAQFVEICYFIDNKKLRSSQNMCSLILFQFLAAFPLLEMSLK